MSIDPNVVPEADREAVAMGFDRYLQRRVEEVNRQDRLDWDALSSRSDWEAFKKPRIKALERSLGRFPRVPDTLAFEVTGQIEADGYVIDKVVFVSREGVLVTANVYRPPADEGAEPDQHQTMRELGLAENEETGIVLVHSHHNPKTQPELQDMGAMWARAGCVVLVMDQFAYGERAEHPAGPRHDYWNRYNSGIQLQLIGDSLMGWMVWDLRRGIDLLEQHYRVGTVVMMGSVAGGGDPCAVTAALDDRVSVAIPFNFGGPQPETTYPLPEDARTSFNYLGTGGWETTRNLAKSGRDGFLPWVIVGAVAPRHLIYAHEFNWDEARDPVWSRLQQIYRWYGAEDRLDHTSGFGLLKERRPEASHCNNVGTPHRERVHVRLQDWLGIDKPEEKEERRPETDLLCLDGERTAEADDLPASYPSIVEGIGQSRGIQFRRSLAWQSPEEAEVALREAWRDLLGDCDPIEAPDVLFASRKEEDGKGVERFALRAGEVVIPVILLDSGQSGPMTLIVSSEGKSSILRDHTEMVEERLALGPVCLPDLRGIGEAATDEEQAPQSVRSSRAATALMLGETSIGLRVKDLRTVIRHLRTREGLTAPIRIANAPFPVEGRETIELDRPLVDPGARIQAQLAALVEEDVVWEGETDTSTGYASQVSGWCVQWPLDAIVPHALAYADLP